MGLMCCTDQTIALKAKAVFDVHNEQVVMNACRFTCLLLSFQNCTQGKYLHLVGRYKENLSMEQINQQQQEVKLSHAVVFQTGLFKAYCVMNAKCHLRNTAARMILFER